MAKKGKDKKVRSVVVVDKELYELLNQKIDALEDMVTGGFTVEGLKGFVKIDDSITKLSDKVRDLADGESIHEYLGQHKMTAVFEDGSKVD